MSEIVLDKNECKSEIQPELSVKRRGRARSISFCFFDDLKAKFVFLNFT